jgi:cytosine/adenosine deaminase-related metal-dependent hydrolase
LVLFARHVLPLDRPRPIEHGFVLIEGPRILQVGERRHYHGPRDQRMLDLGNAVLLPGLINAHCHLDFTGLKGKVPFRGHFGQWLLTMGAWTRALTPADVTRAILDGARESLAWGTTTLCDISSSYASLGLLGSTGLRARVFFEMLDLVHRSPAEYWRQFQLRMNALFRAHPFEERVRWGLALHSAYTVSRDLLDRVGRHLQRHVSVPVTMHVSEGREEAQAFREGSGPLLERLRRVRPAWSIPYPTTPVQYLNQAGWLPKLDLAVHCNTVDERDVRLLARNRVSVVHCPGSHAFFHHPPFPYSRLRRAGVNVCLGTDSLASNRSLSMFREMQVFRRSHPRVPAREILEMATVRAAQAIGEGKRLGAVRPGFLADLVGVEGPEKAPRGEEAVFEHVLRNRKPVVFTMIHGEPKLRLSR